ncbi:MAG: precorrin-4 C(11)-methyltransferase, partial [Actinomycetota bacterium]|nr:precorrin-4 C(11)-methyltransferase [Actinomycetota bacterium]
MSNPRGKVWFVGAGPGAADLLTLRGSKVIAEADVVIWAASLVMAEVVAGARPDAEVLDSSGMTLEDIHAVYDRASAAGLTVARVHSGDPSLYGAIGEQIQGCTERGLDWEIVPGVSSLGAAAAALGRELTVPHVAQSVIITRVAGATPTPDNEDVRAFAGHRTTMALFLSAKRGRTLQVELLAGGYPPDTPCALVYRATWPDEAVYRCRLADLARTLREARLHKHTLVLIGKALDGADTRSHLYAPTFGHEYRRATRAQPSPPAPPAGGDTRGRA